jgi:hypothetical protein
MHSDSLKDDEDYELKGWSSLGEIICEMGLVLVS